MFMFQIPSGHEKIVKIAVCLQQNVNLAHVPRIFTNIAVQFIVVFYNLKGHSHTIWDIK